MYRLVRSSNVQSTYDKLGPFFDPSQLMKDGIRGKLAIVTETDNVLFTMHVAFSTVSLAIRIWMKSYLLVVHIIGNILDAFMNFILEVV